MPVQYRIYFQNDSVMVSVDSTLVELLAFRLGKYPHSGEANLAVQRWLGVAVRKRFGHLVNKNDPVEVWARLCLAEAVLGNR
ncbi:hypothetical protein RCF98_07400 [Thiothrix lacustris]|uniref:Uncharacterized protein n=1 Tax=Thiothrix lacustris TaxID=525917 RepID=A0ABY9MVD7_9GAMM|nr:hypothetical protein [Thiothrix lacustris]WML92160.1 hypothetical protein RCF98_07400 [Thiothrix lacustris]